MEYPKDKLNPDWIRQSITEDTIKWVQSFGSYLAKREVRDERGNKVTYTDNRGNIKDKNIPNLATNQLRKFFGEVKRLQAKGFDPENKTEFILLKPKLAYAVARTKKKEAKIHDFYKIISEAIDLVKSKEDFKRFIQFFEAIVAYHKATEDSKLELESNN